MTCFDALAIATNVPFRTAISGSEIRQILLDGIVPSVWEPQIERALAECPIAMLAQVVFTYPSDEQEAVISNLRMLAAEWHVERVTQWLKNFI